MFFRKPSMGKKVGWAEIKKNELSNQIEKVKDRVRSQNFVEEKEEKKIKIDYFRCSLNTRCKQYIFKPQALLYQKHPTLFRFCAAYDCVLFPTTSYKFKSASLPRNAFILSFSVSHKHSLSYITFVCVVLNIYIYMPVKSTSYTLVNNIIPTSLSLSLLYLLCSFQNNI